MRFRPLPHLLALKPYLLRYRKTFLRGYFYILVKTALALAVPWLLMRGVDGLSHGATPRDLAGIAGLIVLASALSGFFLYAMRWTLIGVSRHLEYDIRNDFFKHLVRLDLPFYQRNRTGDLMARATNDLNAVRDVLGPGIMYALNTTTTVVASVIIMIRLDPLLTLAVLIPFPILAALVARFGREMNRRSLRVQEHYGKLSNAAQENLAGIRVVQSYVQEEAEGEHFTARSREYLEQNLSLIRYRGLFYASVGALISTDALILLWVGGLRVMGGHTTLGELVAFMGYLSQLTWPFIATGWVISLLQRGEAAMQRMLEIWRVEPEIRDAIATPPRPRGEIAYEGVSFRYADGPPALSDIDLRIPAGGKIAIVGRTGSGKTSLAQLLPRLYDVTEGTIRLDGVDIRSLRLSSLRDAIGMVPQDSFLFSDTLENNIRFGQEGATEEEVRHAVRLAGLAGDLENFPHGLATRVGERGITLSGGQRQRMSLARALLKNPPILILDDALSSVDKVTEEALLRTLSEVSRSRTLILIAHRISTVRDADQIVVLEQGRIVERGTHEELLHLDGLYADMARRQALAEELEKTEVAP